MSSVADSRIPVTILTGFLGSGKTTLLNRILREPNAYRIAVIENEFGEAGIDSEILLQNSAEQIIEMSNGCICCTVRGDLANALTDLERRRQAGTLKFDRVIIETTGLADPIPVAQTLFVEPGVHTAYLLDAVITVVDAKHAQSQLDQHQEAQEQVGFADRLLISKSDLVDAPSLEHLALRLATMNPRAAQSRVQFGQIDLAQVLDLRSFKLNTAIEIEPHFLSGEHHHQHADSVSSFVYRSEHALDEPTFNRLMDALIASHGPDLLRYKGVLNLSGRKNRVVFQGVHASIGVEEGPSWGPDERRATTLVFIGRDLPREVIEHGLAQCERRSAKTNAPISDNS